MYLEYDKPSWVSSFTQGDERTQLGSCEDAAPAGICRWGGCWRYSGDITYGWYWGIIEYNIYIYYNIIYYIYIIYIIYNIHIYIYTTTNLILACCTCLRIVGYCRSPKSWPLKAKKNPLRRRIWKSPRPIIWSRIPRHFPFVERIEKLHSQLLDERSPFLIIEGYVSSLILILGMNWFGRVYWLRGYQPRHGVSSTVTTGCSSFSSPVAALPQTPFRTPRSPIEPQECSKLLNFQ